MPVSWFGGGGGGGGGGGDPIATTKVPSMKEAAQVLYPQKRSIMISSGGVQRRSRFSSLFLEHGERAIHDWAVIAYSNPVEGGGGAAAAAAGSDRRMSHNTHQHNQNHNQNQHQHQRNHSSNITSTTPRTSSKQSTQGTTWAAQATPTKSASKKSRRFNPSHSQHLQQTKTQDVSKESVPTAHMTKWEGRLHLCSKSLVLEPQDASRGIVRIPFAKMPDGPPKEYPTLSNSNTNGNGNGNSNSAVDHGSTGPFDPLCVVVTSTRHWVIREHNSIGPYQAVMVPTTFRMTLLHSPPKALVELSQQLFHLMNEPLPPAKYTQALEKILQPMYERPFDFGNLRDVRERPLTSNLGYLPAIWMQPLQSQHGCVVVTQERLYFQPSQGIDDASTSSTDSWSVHSQLVATARRYKGLEDAALELFWKDGSSILFGFARRHDRELVLRVLPVRPCHTDRDFLVQASHAWQSSSITNLDYLLLLNSAAGRSVNDFSRYPVVPWVLRDYESPKLDLLDPATFRDLSLPIGALNPERLEYFRQRYISMQDAVDDPFFYGTHYSAAGYVLYYLARSMPEHMLCLQNGKFDAPDRMFHSVSHTFRTLLTNHADVKELIPEFYVSGDYDFLINARGLQLGATQMGERVNDVALPPWAKSPRDFLRKHRKALESEIVTNMLPRWIDLIFGSKSRGDAAKDACNLFHRYAYMGPADLANLPTPDERFQAELHATEFGLVPDQLFVGPHPLKHETVDESFVNPELGRTFSGTDELAKGTGDAWELLEPPADSSSDPSNPMAEGELGESAVLAAVPSIDETDANFLHRVKEDSFAAAAAAGNVDQLFRTHSRDKPLPLSGTGDTVASGSGAFTYLGKEPTLSNVSSSSALGGGISSPWSMDGSQAPLTTPASNSAEWDIKFIEKSQVHDDAVSGCSMIPHGGPNNTSLLVTTSLDGGLKVHTVTLSGTNAADTTSSDTKNQYQGITSTLSRFSYITMSRGQATPADQSKLAEYRSLTSRDPLACLAMATDGHGGKIAFAGGHDDVVLAYGINSACAVASVYSHRDAVTGLNVLVRPALMTSTALWLEKSTHIMVSGSWDATVKVWSVTVANGETVSINREPLAELFDADSSIVCVAAAAVPDTGGIVVGAGCADGSFCVWNLHSDGVKVVIHKEAARRGSGPCSVVQWSTGPTGKLNLFTGFATGKVASFTLVEGGMKKASAASVGIAVQCLQYSEGILLIGCADGGLRLIPIRDGAYFTSDLSLWPAVNGKSSPGVSSVGISILGNAIDGSGMCICCTGAEDGSVAVFELKRVSPR